MPYAAGNYKKPSFPAHFIKILLLYSFENSKKNYFLFSTSQGEPTLFLRRNILMGTAKRMRPKRLGEKLRSIRNYLDCSLADMAGRLSTKEFSVRRTSVSQYELNDREPPLPVLLRYARIVGITIDILADDELDLPESLLTGKKSEKNKTVK